MRGGKRLGLGPGFKHMRREVALGVPMAALSAAPDLGQIVSL